MKKTFFYVQLILALCITCAIVFPSTAQSIAVPDGYAGHAGTTGGGNASPIIVSTLFELKSAISGSEPRVVVVNGNIKIDNISVGSNKTLVGYDANSGLNGGSLKIQGTNCIIQNLHLGPAEGDVLEVSGATKIFITKCVFHDSTDELCSIVRQSDYVTVSWCKFFFDNPDGHSFAHLIGNSDSSTSDRGKLHVTLHHNWYTYGVRGRMPRVRFGHVHIYNCYYDCTGNGYCVGVGKECNIRLENMHFDGIDDAWADYGGTSNGQIGWNNLKFTNCTQPTFVQNSYPVFDVPYPYTLDHIENTKDIVKQGAGNVFGYTANNSITVAITSPQDSAGYAANSNITIEADATSENSKINYIEFFEGSSLGIDSTDPYAITWEGVSVGVHKIFAIATDTAGLFSYSEEIKIIVGKGVKITSPANNTQVSLPAHINISADAWDYEKQISKVDFYRDSTLIESVQNPPYTITWYDAPEGIYNLIVNATNAENTIIASDTVVVDVPGGPEGFDFCSMENEECNYQGVYNIAFGADGKFAYQYDVIGEIKCDENTFGNPAPGVQKACYVQLAQTPYVYISWPNSGKTYTAPAKMTFTSKAYDNEGYIDSVQYYQNNNYIGVATKSPFAFTWRDVPAGNYKITAIAFDNEGNTGVSDSTLIIVTNPTGINDPNYGLVELYPNPTSGELTIELNKQFDKKTKLSIYDTSGKIFLNENVSWHKKTVNLQKYPSGTYFISISSDEKNIVRKIIKD